jgi:lysophospholipase L1-like esterase
MPVIQVFSPAQLVDQVNPAPISGFDLQFLAQGDSWFSFGAVPPLATTNLFDGMPTTIAACAVNCAHPGAELQRMASTTREKTFLGLLGGKAARRWSGLLLSGGGNDLIAAAQSGPANPEPMRLLATKSEWTNAPGGERYLSNAGWQTFATHLEAVIRQLLARRDASINAGMPVVMHAYDLAVPRPAGAGLGLAGPWLEPAMRAFGIPEDQWAAVARALMARLSVLLDHVAATTVDGSLHVVHSQGTLISAKTTDTGATADWDNEIHPTPAGYRKLSALWQPVLDAVFGNTVTVAATDGEVAVVPRPGDL